MKRAELLRTLDAVKPGLSTKDIIEHAQSFVFTENEVVTYNDEVSIRAGLSVGFVGAVPAAPLLNFLRKATAEEVAITSDGEKCLVKSGRARAGIPMLAEVPAHLVGLKIPKKGWQKMPEGLTHAMQFTSFCASTDMSSPVLTCIHITEGKVEAGDNYRFARYNVEGDLPTFLFPASNVANLVAFNATEFILAEAWIHFRNEAKAVFSRRINAGSFMDQEKLDELFSVKGKTITFPEKLPLALERAGVFAVADFDNDREVKLTTQGGRLTVRAEGSDGWFEETLGVDTKEELTFGVHPTLLLEILAHSQKAVFDGSKLLFKDKNFQLVMAV